MKKSFYSWLQQFKSDETPLGDFARDTKADKDFPYQATSYKHIHDYLESKRACAEVLDIFNKSYEQYKKTNETKATELTSDLIVEFPDAKGFSPTNLKYAFYFYDLYKEEVQNRQQLVDDLCRIPWGHHVQIIGKCKNDSKKALFYIEQIIQNNWSRNVLAKYSLESSAEPLAVSEYELAKLYPVDFKSSLPTIEEIESELGEIK